MTLKNTAYAGLAGLLGLKRRDHDHRDHIHTDRDRTTTPR